MASKFAASGPASRCRRQSAMAGSASPSCLLLFVWSVKLDMLMALRGSEEGQYNVLIAAEFGGNVGAFLPCGACWVIRRSYHKQMPALQSASHCAHGRRADRTSVIRHNWSLDLYVGLEFWTFFCLKVGVDLYADCLICGSE